jgi:hypothetical protein
MNTLVSVQEVERSVLLLSGNLQVPGRPSTVWAKDRANQVCKR